MTQNSSDAIGGFLSPRNFIKMISESIDQYKKNKNYSSLIPGQDTLVQTFQPYLNTFSKEYQQYQSKIKKKQVIKNNQKNEEIQLQIKLSKIPSQYFDQKFQLKMCKKSSIRQNQQQLSQYLDQIQIVLFSKTSKRPFKSIQVMNNLDDTAVQIDKSLKKVLFYRQQHNKKLLQISKKQLKVKKIQNYARLLEQKLNYLRVIKKLKEIKQLAGSELQNKNKASLNLSLVEQIKKKQLKICQKIVALKSIIANLQNYRMQIKQKIFGQFRQQIISIMAIVLKYDKDQWKRQKASQNVGNNGNILNQYGNQQLLNQSNLNITILDQSYFALEGNLPNNVFKTESQRQIITDRNAVGDGLFNLQEVWKNIIKYDLYDQVQISQLIMRELVKHNAHFSKDLNDYLQQLCENTTDCYLKNNRNKSQIKQKNSYNQAVQVETVQKNVEKKLQFEQTKKQAKNFTKKTLSTLKKYGKIPNFMYQGQKKNQIFQDSNTPLNQKSQTNKSASSPVSVVEEEILQKINIKLYMKAIMFYYDILMKFAFFIKSNSKLGFLKDFQPKFYSFIQSRVKYFIDIRKVTGQTSIQDLLTYLSVIQFWDQHCQQIYLELKKLKQSIIDDYLTNLQKSILVTELKQAIDQSKYIQTGIRSDMINTLNYVVGWKKIKELKKYEDFNMSMTFIYNDRQKIQNILAQHKQLVKLLDPNYFRIIDKILVVQGKQHKVCDSFLILVNQIEKYLKLRDLIPEFAQNVQEKLCEVVGFYVWYNQKILNGNPKSSSKPKTLKNLCVFSSTLSLLKHMFVNFQIKNKKYTKTMSQFEQCETQMQKNLTMTPFLLLEEQISGLYQSKVTSKFQIPCAQTLKIVQIIQKSLQQFKQFFPLQKIKKMLQPSIKMIYKNYFGYMISLQKRGFLQLKQFVPLLKNSLLNYGFDIGLLKNQKNKIFQQTHIFLSEIQSMQKTLKSKISQIK